jgi:hypothetical protein
VRERWVELLGVSLFHAHTCQGPQRVLNLLAELEQSSNSAAATDAAALEASRAAGARER